MSTSDIPRIPRIPRTTLEALLAHRDWARALARRLVRDEHAADDLAQEAMVAALERPPGAAGAMRAWLGTVMRRKAMTAHRGESRRSARERRHGERAGMRASDEIVAEAEAHRRVVDAVLSLAERDRVLVLLRFYEDVPLPEIAKQLDVPYETARARLRRALEKLRRQLDEEHGGVQGWALPLIGGLATREAPSAWPRVAASVAVAVTVGAVAWWAISGSVGASTVADTVADVGEESAALEEAATGDEDAAGLNGRERAGDRSGRPGRARVGEGAVDGVASPGEPMEQDSQGEREEVKVPPRVTPKRIVEGVIVTADGTPIPGARIYVDPWGPEQPDSTTSGASGEFRIEVPDFGKADENGVIRQTRLSVSARGFVQQRLEISDVVGKDVKISLDPKSAGAVVFRVVGSDGSPRAGIEVHIRTNDERYKHLGSTRTSDESGEIRIEGRWPEGAHVEGLVLSKNGTRVLAGARVDADGAEIELRLMGTRRVRVDLRFTGQPVPVTHVEFAPRTTIQARVTWEGDASATLELPEVAKRLRVVTVAGVSDWVEIAPDATQIVVTLATVGVTSIVLDVTGVKNAEYVRVTGAFTRDGAIAGWNIAASLLKDDEGRLVLPAVDGVVYTLMVVPNSGNLRWRFVTSSTASPFRVADEQAREPVIIHVEDDGGTAIAGAKISARVENTTAQEKLGGVTDPEGNAQLDLIPGLPYRVAATAAGTAGGLTTFVADADPNAGPVRVVLERAVPRRLRLRADAIGRKIMVMPFAPNAGAPAQAEIDGGVVTFAASAEHWSMLMTEHSFWLVAPVATDGDVVDVSGGERVAVTVRGGPRFALLGADPVAPGIHPVALTMGDGTSLPPGRFVPVDSDGTTCTVFPVLLIAASDEAQVVGAPDAEGLEWQEGAAPDGASGVLYARVIADDGSFVEIPVGMIAPGRETRWRTAGPEIRFERTTR